MRYNIPMELTEGMILRYSRNILIREIGPEGQERIFGSSVLVVGAGGLGSPAVLHLAAAGDDIRAIRSDVVLEELGTALTAENAVSLFRKYDVVIDGSDNFPTKYLCSDASVLTGVPLVHAGVLRFGGQLTTVIPGTGACLRCLIPEIPPRRDAPTCGESGILGAVAGIVGAWQAVEAIKVITGAGEPMTGRLLTLDALTGSVSVHAVSRDPQCPACGESPRIRLPLEPSEYDQERSCIV